MRILIVHQFLWSHYKAKIYSALFSLTQKQNISLKVLQTSKNEKTRANLGTIDLSIHQYDYDLQFDDYYENTRFLDRVIDTLKRVWQSKPDVINLPGYYEPAMIVVMFVCKLMGIKVILSIDSTEADNANVWWREQIKKMIIRQADGFFCYGSQAAQYMVKLGADDTKNLVKNNAVDNALVAQIHTEAIKSRDEVKTKLRLPTYNFIFVGRLLKLKNLTRVLKAFSENTHPNWGFIILGDGAEEQSLKNYVSEFKIKNVTFIEGQGWKDVPKYMALADIFILPSFSEAWGLVVNEAMVCGMPVIVSDKCGCAVDLVYNERNGFIFDTYSAEDLAQKMRFFIDNPDKIEPFGRESKEIIKRFSPENVAKEMLDGFRIVCK